MARYYRTRANQSITTISTIWNATKLLICYMLNGVATSIITDRFWEKPMPPLPDKIFDNLPFIPESAIAADLVAITFVIITGVTIFVHKDRAVIFSIISDIGAAFYTVRFVVILATQYPPPFPNAREKCTPPSKSDFECVVRGVFLVFDFLAAGSSKILCGDTMFSGHTGLIIVCGHVSVRFAPPYRFGNVNFGKMVAVVINVAGTVGIVSLLLSRGHYLSDVIIGAVVAYAAIQRYDDYDDFIQIDMHHEG